jgi:hypothetical protein
MIVKSWVNGDPLHNSGSNWPIASAVNGWLAGDDVGLPPPNHQAAAAISSRPHTRIRRLMPSLR